MAGLAAFGLTPQQALAVRRMRFWMGLGASAGDLLIEFGMRGAAEHGYNVLFDNFSNEGDTKFTAAYGANDLPNMFETDYPYMGGFPDIGALDPKIRERPKDDALVAGERMTVDVIDQQKLRFNLPAGMARYSSMRGHSQALAVAVTERRKQSSALRRGIQENDSRSLIQLLVGNDVAQMRYARFVFHNRPQHGDRMRCGRFEYLAATHVENMGIGVLDGPEIGE